MADSECNNDDLYSLDYPELRERVDLAGQEGENVTSTGNTVMADEGTPKVVESTPQVSGSSDANPATPELAELRDSTREPIRTPSPSYVLSDEQREFNNRLKSHRADEQRNRDERMRKLQADIEAAKALRQADSFALSEIWKLRLNLDTRQRGFELAQNQYARGNPFRLPPPYNLDARMRLLGYPSLLAEYYEQEKRIENQLRLCSDYARNQIESGNRMDMEIFALNDKLNDMAAVRERDVEEKNDAKVLTALLDDMAARLQSATDAKLSGAEVGTDRITDLPKSLQDAVARYSELEDRLNDMRQDERDFFPERFPKMVLKLRGSSEYDDQGSESSGYDALSNSSDDLPALVENLEEVTIEDFKTSKLWKWD
ncbi:hypothetical protein K458DRAFT_451914 [Lentithecium fluviatile CBS 122367]|uniref:Uncharacterized protein n=1 Tax=Lentithecium fluviatile CBS 122367 TaxID=1168545 RepID=A0A6G1J1G2_9PLEO|nr:hypothetical protein K458DRAFT_451914 [Lentithecium fluviatile CBS 122367]